MNYKEYLIIYLKGLAMGAADAVPGVSGGTIALITGIYERLIHAVTSVNLENARNIFEAVRNWEIGSVEKVLNDMDVYFLGVLLAGILSAVVLVLRVMHFLLQNFTVPTFGFFFGLIFASVIVLWRKVDVSSRKTKIAAVSGFLLAFLTSGYAATSLGHSLPVIFFAGLIAVSAMVLPGISGSLMLIILGQYEYISGALTEFTGGVIHLIKTGETEALFNASPPIIVFLVGATAGVLTVAHTVRHALESHRKVTMAFLVSLVAGALRAPVVEVEKTLVKTGNSWPEVFPVFASAAVVGGVLLYVLDMKAGLVE